MISKVVDTTPAVANDLDLAPPPTGALTPSVFTADRSAHAVRLHII